MTARHRIRPGGVGVEVLLAGQFAILAAELAAAAPHAAPIPPGTPPAPAAQLTEHVQQANREATS